MQSTRVDGYLVFLCSFVLQHKGSDVPSAAHNVVYIINLCSLVTPTSLHNFECIIQVITLQVKLQEVTPGSDDKCLL